MTATAIHTSAELADFIRSHEHVHVIGRGSKTALHPGAKDAALADLSALNGVAEYQPSEYTITVGAGTGVTDVAAALAEAGQYLPFDPLLADCATIGGTVAANLSGSRRFRYGGARDFILDAQVVDGLGREFRVGGKVVKNSAGFDLSKFLVGSLGQYAIMTELTFKVFPDVSSFRSLKMSFRKLDDLLSAISVINQSAFELDALDFAPSTGGWSLLARLGGSPAILPGRVQRFTETMKRETDPDDVCDIDDGPALWNPLEGLRGNTIVKVVLPLSQVPALDAMIADSQRRYGVGGNLAWVGTDDVAGLDAALRQLGLRGLCLLGDVESPVIGQPLENKLAARVKAVLDPLAKLV
ncbi:MAG: FAD-binding protein [Chloroflexi bacterium]|nr:FAD-binding protein [Chloroflexota bacterium]